MVRVTLIDQKTAQATDVELSDDKSGLLPNIKLNDDATRRLRNKVGINNLTKTQNTYKDVDGKGANTLSRCIPSNDTSHGKYRSSTGILYVKEKCVCL